MGCEWLRLGDGTVAIICGRRQPRGGPCGCGKPGQRQCDFPLAGAARGKVCNRFVCASCTTAWSPEAPVQPSPAYRKKHGNLDLCRVHADFVARGRGPGLLALLTALRDSRGDLRARLEAATLEELPAVLDDGAKQATDWCLRHLFDQPPPPALVRLETLGTAMTALARSLRAAGAAVVVVEAEHDALEHLQRLTPAPPKGTRP